MDANPPDDPRRDKARRHVVETDGGRDLTDDEIAKEQPHNYRHWPTASKIEYLTISYSRGELLRAIRHKIESDESTDRLKKREIARITLEMRIAL